MSIEAYQNGQSVGQSVETFARLSDQISNTEFVPASMRGKPAVVLACMMYGAELGLGPMQSLNMIQSIQGSVGLKPEGMRALVVQQGHRIWPEEYSDTAVTYCGWRKGDPADRIVKASFTIADAKRAGLDQGQSWKKYPRSMLSARATAELCRLHFADVIGGLSYTPDEIESFDRPALTVHSSPKFEADEDGVVIEQAALPAPEPEPTQTVRRGPPVPEGHVSKIEAMKQILAEYMKMPDAVLENAQKSARAYWDSYQITTPSIPQEKLDNMLSAFAEQNQVEKAVPVGADIEDPF